ncbi:MAG TPA: DUF2844 domain-containing protein [Terriglobales bacterium]|nr:DUF2844 domain-containing protein [Terriglobales bacterium]
MKHFRLLLPFVLFAGMVTPAWATLGEAAQSVQSDQVRMRGTLRVSQQEAYTVHELHAPYGTVVREYVSPSSAKVFAVTWQGPRIPDLQQLLGSYFDQFTRAVRSRRGHGPLLIELPGLVVQSTGHQRSFTGRAYLPQEVPSGVRAHSLQ